MIISDWTPFYKYDNDGTANCMSQQTYEPLISPDGKTFCANYDWQNKYQRIWQPDRIGYTQDVVEYFFDKEVEYAKRFSNRIWAPEIIDIDYINKHIFYKWYGTTCNEILYTGGTLPYDWKSQIRKIMIDAYNSGVYKLTMYPHCHYFDSNGIMHTIDMYGCVEVTDPFISARYMDGIIHSTAQFRLDETGDLVNGKYNLETMFKQSLSTHVRWGEDDMYFIYKEMFNA
jgi:hypothetical protein